MEVIKISQLTELTEGIDSNVMTPCVSNEQTYKINLFNVNSLPQPHIVYSTFSEESIVEDSEFTPSDFTTISNAFIEADNGIIQPIDGLYKIDFMCNIQNTDNNPLSLNVRLIDDTSNFIIENSKSIIHIPASSKVNFYNSIIVRFGVGEITNFRIAFNTNKTTTFNLFSNNGDIPSVKIIMTYLGN